MLGNDRTKDNDAGVFNDYQTCCLSVKNVFNIVEERFRIML